MRARLLAERRLAGVEQVVWLPREASWRRRVSSAVCRGPRMTPLWTITSRRSLSGRCGRTQDVLPPGRLLVANAWSAPAPAGSADLFAPDCFRMLARRQTAARQQQARAHILELAEPSPPHRAPGRRRSWCPVAVQRAAAGFHQLMAGDPLAVGFCHPGYCMHNSCEGERFCYAVMVGWRVALEHHGDPRACGRHHLAVDDEDAWLDLRSASILQPGADRTYQPLR